MNSLKLKLRLFLGHLVVLWTLLRRTKFLSRIWNSLSSTRLTECWTWVSKPIWSSPQLLLNLWDGFTNFLQLRICEFFKTTKFVCLFIIMHSNGNNNINSQFPSAICWRKKSNSYNHKTTIWVSHYSQVPNKRVTRLTIAMFSS